MTPEQEILADVLLQLDASSVALSEALSLIGDFPSDLASFEALGVVPRVASTAMLKQVEQVEDALARSFRTVLKLLGQDVRGLYALDIGDRMAQLGILDDADAWVAVVKLRNALVHEYPLGSPDRFARLSQAHASIPLLLDASRRVATYVRSRGWLNQ